MEGASTVSQRIDQILGAMNRVIFGQGEVLKQTLTCLLAGGHVLLEGVPGLGKTLLARTLAKLVDAQYRRIQFTPDLLPSDIVGTSIFDPRSGEFSLHKGPIFTEILLADEVNRTPPKSQSALLEGMEERQVTIDGTKHALSDMFFVIATQNPVEYEGTYPLPETQLDRFMMKIVLDYPSAEAELSVVRSYAKGIDLHNLDALIPQPLTNKAEIMHVRQRLRAVVVRDEVLKYMHRIAAETRDPVYVQLGASTRAVVALLKSARTAAAMRGLSFVTPDEVKDVTLPVLRHRLILKPEVLIDGLTPDYYLTDILRRIPVPR